MADAIRKLREAVEAGRDHSEKWHPALGEHGYTAMMAFHGDLNAAKALHDALVPGWRLGHLQQFEAGHWYARIYEPQGEDWPKWTPFPYREATNDNPARAWLLAILRAMEAEGRG